MKQKLTIKQDQFEQEIDLNEFIDGDISNDAELVREIAQGLIDYMVARVEAGKGIGGVDLAEQSYSQTYSKSLKFAAASKGKKVNMTLTGDMLRSIDLLSEDGSVVVIGIEDETERAKAYGHQTGFRNHPTIKKAKPRRFFGLTSGEIEKVLKEFKSQISESTNARTYSDTQQQDQAIDFVVGSRKLSDIFK